MLLDDARMRDSDAGEVDQTDFLTEPEFQPEQAKPESRKILIQAAKKNILKSKPDTSDIPDSKFVRNDPVGTSDKRKAENKANSPSSEKKPSLEKFNPQNYKDPRKIVANEADKYLHLGRQTGHALWVIWELSVVIGSFPLIVTGIPGLLMLNLLLISPKLCYKITTWLLLLIPAILVFFPFMLLSYFL